MSSGQSPMKKRNITNARDDNSDQDLDESIEVLGNVEKKVYQKSSKKRPYRRKQDSDEADPPGYMVMLKKYVITMAVPLISAYVMSMMKGYLTDYMKPKTIKMDQSNEMDRPADSNNYNRMEVMTPVSDSERLAGVAPVIVESIPMMTEPEPPQPGPMNPGSYSAPPLKISQTDAPRRNVFKNRGQVQLLDVPDNLIISGMF